MRTAMSHGGIQSLFVHQRDNPDVLSSPAGAPSVLGIARWSAWGSFLGKEPCHHFEHSEGLWSFKSGLRKKRGFFFVVSAYAQLLNVSYGCRDLMQWLVKGRMGAAILPQMGLKPGEELKSMCIMGMRRCFEFLSVSSLHSNPTLSKHEHLPRLF